ncbi:MAG TPA: hypothetical protein VHM20_07700 [Gammaproteobacteria bacterium]|jgi:3-phosphoshikimate 1-carboxyvinyltransferase|nr:hypothetical protein [Gammaproteobacteria bacterium]
MNQTIPATKVAAKIYIPGSKEMTYRALFLGALADGVSELRDIFISKEMLALVTTLRELGLMIQLDQETRTCIIGGGGGKLPRETGTLFFDHGRTEAILILAICATSVGTYQFDAREVLKPIITLFHTALTRLGTKMTPTSIMGQDGLRGGEVELEHDHTAILISALLMVAPFAKKPILIKTDDSIIQPLIEMTCEMMADFNVLVRRMHSGRYSVPVPQRYTARDYVIEPDLSIALNFFAGAAVLGSSVMIQPVNRKTAKQSDVEFLQVLEKMGCVIIENEAGLTVHGPEELKGVNVDTRHFPDAFMALAAMAPFAKTPTTITNIRKMRNRDGERLSLMHKELEKLNVKVEEGKDWLKIYPSELKIATVDAHDDPRIAMALSIIRLKVPGINIQGVDCAEKICPGFLEMWGQLLLSS